MEQLAVSELQQITVEIKVLKQQTAQNIIEIGKRLKQVKESLPHGDFGKWISEEVDFTWQTADKFIRVAEQFGNYATSRNLSTGKLFELIALPESVDRKDFIEQPHSIPSTGETKKVDDMTVKELREVKQSLKSAELRAKQAEEQAQSLIERASAYRAENERLKAEKNPEPQVIEVEKVVEILPHDYHDALSKNQEMNTKIALLTGEMDTIRREYERKLRDVQDGDVKANRRELQRLLSEQLKALDWNHSSALFLFQRLGGNAEATRSVRDFIDEYQTRVQSQLNDWKNAMSLNHEEEAL